MSQEILGQREVIHVDIAYDELSSGEYREDLVSQLLLEVLALSPAFIAIQAEDLGTTLLLQCSWKW